MSGKWVIIYIAHGDNAAQAVQQALETEGFLCRINPIARGGAAEACYELLTLSQEAQEARDLLQEKGF